MTIGNNTQATVRRCSIHGWSSDTSNPGAHAFYWRGSNGLIEFNEIYDNNGYGVQFYNAARGVNNNVFRNNYVHDHNGKIGLYIGTWDGNQAYNNIIVKNRGGIIVVGTHTKIFNNTVCYNTGNGLHVRAGSEAVLQNNIVYSNGRNIWNQGSNTTIDHNLTSDPLFVDPASSDFTLQAASPAIDAGLTLSEVRYDYENSPAPKGAATISARMNRRAASCEAV